MKIYHDLKDIDIKKPTAIALGNFDGVHKGHQELMRRAVAAGKEKGLKSAVFTFSNHPRNLLAGEDVVKNILYPDEKRRIIESMGVDILFDIPFTWDICGMEPVRYIEELLFGAFRAQEIFCGFNYTFGYKAGGDVRLLEEEGARHGAAVHVLEPVMVGGKIVSSTLIRECIEAGNIEACDSYLGRPYTLNGKVVHGNEIGRTIGFPTCNLLVDETMVTPPNGVYVTNCLIEETVRGAHGSLKTVWKRYPAVTNIGVKPTIGTFTKNVETHIFDFNRDMYDVDIRVEFLKMTRLETKFDSLEALKEQIARDCAKARAYHNI